METRTCQSCTSEFQVNVHRLVLCPECEGRMAQEKKDAALYGLFAARAHPQWIKLTKHGLERISELYEKGCAGAQERRTPEEEAFFAKFCELWDYREYCNRTRDGRYHGWWFRLQQRIKFWILNHLE